MYKKAWCTCKVVVLRNKPIAFLTSGLPSPSSLLKLPGWFRTGTSVDDGARKSKNWLDQWHSRKLGTGSRVYSLPCAFLSSNNVPILLLNQPNNRLIKQQNGNASWRRRAQIKPLAWPMAERQVGHRKSNLFLSARFLVVKWRSRSVAKSA